MHILSVFNSPASPFGTPRFCDPYWERLIENCGNVLTRWNIIGTVSRLRSAMDYCLRSRVSSTIPYHKHTRSPLPKMKKKLIVRVTQRTKRYSGNEGTPQLNRGKRKQHGHSQWKYDILIVLGVMEFFILRLEKEMIPPEEKYGINDLEMEGPRDLQFRCRNHIRLPKLNP